MKRAHNFSSAHSSNNTNTFQKLSILLQAVIILHFFPVNDIQQYKFFRTFAFKQFWQVNLKTQNHATENQNDTGNDMHPAYYTTVRRFHGNVAHLAGLARQNTVSSRSAGT